MSEMQDSLGDSSFTTAPNGNAEILKYLNQNDPDFAEFFLEVTNMLVTGLRWDTGVASRFVLDWAADSYFGEEYKLRFMDYYE